MVVGLTLDHLILVLIAFQLGVTGRLWRQLYKMQVCLERRLAPLEAHAEDRPPRDY